MSPAEALMFVVLLTAWLAWVGEAQAWTADQPWRTVETAHYRVHPLDSEARASTRWRAPMPSGRVARVVGYAPDRKVDLVLMDPAVGQWLRRSPLASPLMGSFPPHPVPHRESDTTGCGQKTSCCTKTCTSSTCFGRPNPGSASWARDFSASAPRSGAGLGHRGLRDLVEGGSPAGRPNSDSRAAWLRTLARHGQLPTYPELDGSGRWRSGSMRYLVGSAYLSGCRPGPAASPFRPSGCA